MRNRIVTVARALLVVTLVSGATAWAVIFTSFEPGDLLSFDSSDPGQFVGGTLTGVNLDTATPGEWRIFDGKLDPPQGTRLNGVYCPMFEQIIDGRVLTDVRIEASFFTGVNRFNHPGILFRGTDVNNFGWLYLRPHFNGSGSAVVLSSASNGFWSRSGGSVGGPHFEGLVAGPIPNVGFNQVVDMTIEIIDDELSLFINGVLRISSFDILAAGYASAGVSGLANCDNQDSSAAFLSFSVTDLLADSDGDGVDNADDACPASDLSPTIVIGGDDTGVANELFADGCTIADLIAQLLAADASMDDIVHFLVELKGDGIISGQDMGAILRALNDP